MMKPCNPGHGCCKYFGEGSHLSLYVNKEGVWAPKSNDTDGAFRYVRLMQGHITPILKRVCADLIRLESQALKDELECVKAQEFNDLGVGNLLCGGGRVGVVSADWGVGVYPVFQRWRKWQAVAERGLP